jgi:hypothetical protein
MNQAETILKLCQPADLLRHYVTRNVLTAPDVRLIGSVKESARDVLARMRIRQCTTQSAGAYTVGIQELIEALSELRVTDEVMGFAFDSESNQLVGKCYTDIEMSRLIGCAWVRKRSNPPSLDPRLVGPESPSS